MTHSDPPRRVDASSDEAAVLELLGFAPPAGSPALAAPALVASALVVPAPSDAVLVASVPAPVELAPIASVEVTPTEVAVDVSAELTSRRALRDAERAAAQASARPKGGKGESGALSNGPRSRTPRVAIARTPSARERAAQRRSARARTIGSRLLSVGAMLFAGALAIGMSVPANAFGPSASDAAATSGTSSTVVSEDAESQSVAVSAEVAGAAAARDDYSVTSWAQMLVQQYGTRDYSYSAGGGAIRWPFPYTVPISSGFGERAAPCQACSSIHMGLDFVPGEGAPIYAMADGVVATHDDDGGGFGNHVIIDHGNLLGDGNDIASLYAHMQRGSSPLVVGQTIKAGDFIGLVGRTGVATGNHLHFEVHVGGVQVDPFAWLKKNSK